MDSSGEISLLCRLCLVKEQVNVPIFGENGDIRQIFLKISSCLPVKVSKEDPLPKNICEGCSDKLDSLYTFWNTSRDAEKTLLSWLQQAQVDNADEAVSAISKQISAQSELVKEETELTQDVSIKEDNDETGAPPAKRARRTAAVKAQISISQEESEEEDDVDEVEPLTKVEDESDMSDNDGTDDQPLSTFVDMPGTSVDEEQAGPSGVGKEAADAPFDPESSVSCEACHRTHKSSQSPLKDILKKHVCCEQFFFKPHLLEEHIQKYHTQHWNREKIDSVFQFKCRHCPYWIHDFPDIKRHVSVHHSRGSKTTLLSIAKCPECSRKFDTDKSLDLHVRKCHTSHYDWLSTNKFKCKHCPAVYGHKLDVLTHVQLKHRNEMPGATCQICSKTFLSQVALNLHMVQTHNLPKPYVCSYCKQGYDELKELSAHMQLNHMPKVQKNGRCRLCNVQVGHVNAFLRHVHKVHPGTDPAECSEKGGDVRREEGVVDGKLKREVEDKEKEEEEKEEEEEMVVVRIKEEKRKEEAEMVDVRIKQEGEEEDDNENIRREIIKIVIKEERGKEVIEGSRFGCT